MRVLKDYNGNEYWDFDTMKKYYFSNENDIAKIKINNIIIQTDLSNKFIDDAKPDLLECIKSGLYIKFVKKSCPYKGRGRPSLIITPEEKLEAKREYYRKYYDAHKIRKSLPVVAVH